jgi:hypothetical protein
VIAVHRLMRIYCLLPYAAIRQSTPHAPLPPPLLGGGGGGGGGAAAMWDLTRMLVLRGGMLAP